MLLAGLLLVGSLAAASAMRDLHLEAPGTSVSFILGTTFHEVHGSMEVREGEILFDPSTRELSGRVVIDATSASTNHKKRDQKMHKQVLESGHYPDIVFVPTRFDGNLHEGRSDLRIDGSIEIHGSTHPVQFPAHVLVAGDSITGTAGFTVPYVEWGMRDPSVLMFRAEKEVHIELKFSGSVQGGDIAGLEGGLHGERTIP
jgi:polyisoprenoid-binding protein YceI